MSERYKELHSYVRYDEHDPDTCKLWEGAIDKEGRGFVRFRGERWNVPRLVLSIIQKRYLKDEEVVLHLCNTPRCYNPLHLSVGSQKENMVQMVREGRARNQYSI